MLIFLGSAFDCVDDEDYDNNYDDGFDDDDDDDVDDDDDDDDDDDANKECWLCPSMKWVKKGRQGQVSPPK